MFEVQAVVFDVGRVIVQWDLRCLFGKLIADERELEWFVSNVVTEEWHFQHDAGRDLAWITTTADNQLHAFTLAAGVPEEEGTVGTIADAHNLLVLADGTLVLASATGAGLQVITDPEL